MISPILGLAFLQAVLGHPLKDGAGCRAKHAKSTVTQIHTVVQSSLPIATHESSTVAEDIASATSSVKVHTTQTAESSPTVYASTTTTQAVRTSSAAVETPLPEDSSSDTSPAVELSAAFSGTSTFYGGNLNGGMCSFSTYTLPSHLYGTAFSGAAWDSAANCGACLEVTGPTGDSIKVMIVDQCPECEKGHLDLFENAFHDLDPSADGVMETSYKFVECGITSPIKLHNKSGTSPYWFSMQVINANEPITSLEVSTDGGASWQATARAEYNFFENQSGFGTEKVDIRVGGESGKKIVVKNVAVTSDSEVEGTSNF